MRHELDCCKHNPVQQFELLDPIYRGVLFRLYPIKSKRSSLWSSIVVTGRGMLALVMLSMSVVSGYVAYSETNMTSGLGRNMS